jgi:hypothetical protein
MPLRSLTYDTLQPLVRQHLSTEEDSKTLKIIHDLREARRRGYLRLSELETICYWKSPRAIRHIRSNSANSVRGRTREALATRSERARLEALRSLSGVSVPMASSVLMLLDPKRYGVIDIRVWELLHKFGAVTKNPGGVGFSFSNWYQYLMIIRYFAKMFGCKARDIERTLFLAHKKFQLGQLYGSRG